MDALPTNFWELPTIAVICLLVIGALGYYIIKQNTAAGQERQQHIEFVEGLVKEAKEERNEAKLERAAWIKTLSEQNEAWQKIASSSTEAIEDVCSAIKQLDRNEQLRHNSLHSKIAALQQ